MLKSFAGNVLTRGVTVLVTVISTLVIAKILGTKARGEYGFIITLIGNMSLLFNFGLGNFYLSKYNSSHRTQNKSSILLYLLILALFMVVCSLLSLVVGTFVEINLIIFILLLSGIFIQIINGYGLCYQNANGKLNHYYKFILLSKSTYLMFLTILLVLSITVDIYLILMISVSTAAITTMQFLGKSTRLDISFDIKVEHFSILSLKQMILSALRLHAATIFTSFFLSLDIYFLSYYSTFEVIGTYHLALQLMTPIFLFGDIIYQFFLKMIIDQDSKSVLNKQFRIIFMVAMIMLTCFPMVKPISIIIVGFIGDEYEPIIGLINYFYFFSILKLINSILSAQFLMRNEYNYLLLVSCMALVLNFALNFLFVPILGALGAIIASIATFALISIMSGIKILKDF